MSIRTRLALWYAGIMFVSLLAMGILSYHAFAPEPHSAKHNFEEPGGAGEPVGGRGRLVDDAASASTHCRPHPRRRTDQ